MVGESSIQTEFDGCWCNLATALVRCEFDPHVLDELYFDPSNVWKMRVRFRLIYDGYEFDPGMIGNYVGVCRRSISYCGRRGGGDASSNPFRSANSSNFFQLKTLKTRRSLSFEKQVTDSSFFQAVVFVNWRIEKYPCPSQTCKLLDILRLACLRSCSLDHGFDPAYCHGHVLIFFFLT